MDKDKENQDRPPDTTQRKETTSIPEPDKNKDLGNTHEEDSPLDTMVKEAPGSDVTLGGTKTAIINDLTLNQDQMLAHSPEDTRDRTKIHFSSKDIPHEIGNELDEVPEGYSEDLMPNEISVLLKDVFPEKSEAEKIRVNRRFLRDAEPFDIDRLKSDLTKESRGLVTGFWSLDERMHISTNTITAITGLPNHGKTIFMQNLMISMARMYPDLHFIYYTYEEPRHEVEIKLLNMCGDTCFPKDNEINGTNLEKWKYELRTKDISAIKELEKTKAEYRGLVNFLGIANRIHVVDSYYHINHLTDSIKSFCNTFVVGAVFVDPVQRIPLVPSEKKFIPEVVERKEIVEKLSYISRQYGIAVVVSSRIPLIMADSNEYDQLTLNNIHSQDGFLQEAGLLIALQNYSKSTWLGSGLGKTINSTLMSEPLEKGIPMPDYLKTRNPETIILTKILTNRFGAEFETELLFHRWLLKVSDLTAEAIEKIQGYTT